MARKPNYTTSHQITVEKASEGVAVVPNAGRIARIAGPDVGGYRDQGTSLFVDQLFMTRDRVIRAVETLMAAKAVQ